MLDHFLTTTDDYMCLLHEAMPTNNASCMRRTLQRCTFLVIAKTYAAKGVVY